MATPTTSNLSAVSSVPPAAALPAKKRKTSNASSHTSNISSNSSKKLNNSVICENNGLKNGGEEEEKDDVDKSANADVVAGGGGAKDNDQQLKAPPPPAAPAAASASIKTALAKDIASERSLPSKKRRASLAESLSSSDPPHHNNAEEMNPPRKGSQDSSASSGVMLPRSLPPIKRILKGSLDDSASTSLNKPPLVPPPRKGSQDSNAVSSTDGLIRRQRKGSLESYSSFEFVNSSRKCSDATATNTMNSLQDDLINPTALPSPGNKSSNTAAQLHPLRTSSSLNALDHLDALGPAAPAPGAVTTTTTNTTTSTTTAGTVGHHHPINNKKERKDSDADNSSSAHTSGSSGQRLLLEAIMMTTSSSSQPQQQQQQPAPHGQAQQQQQQTSSTVPAPVASSSAVAAARERLESWGGMSDLSLTLNQPLEIVGGPVAAPATANPSTGGAPAASTAAAPAPASAIPSRISLQRDRLNSLASMSEASINIPMMLDVTSTSCNSSTEGGGGAIVMNPGDLQAYVAAAVASVGDQLAELAGAVESAASFSDEIHLEVPAPAAHDPSSSGTGVKNSSTGSHHRDMESEVSSVASPIIGAVSDPSRAARAGAASSTNSKVAARPRTWSTSSSIVAVDYDAVQAAVDAADAATGSLNLKAISSIQPSTDAVPDVAKSLSKAASSSKGDTKNKTKATSGRGRATRKRKLPLTRARGDSKNSQKSAPNKSTSEVASSKPSAKPPLKKRAKRNFLEPDNLPSASLQNTPKVSNKSLKDPPPDPLLSAPFMGSVKEAAKTPVKGPASQKWDQMYECLKQFAEERRQEETKGMTEKEKEGWVWDGNVPTTHKTKDGKALGRWVNNQRSAKSKGTLKEEREERLVEAGLKWSAVPSNAWNEVFEELCLYVKEQTKDGKKWDGNVPTNYQIKTRPNSQFQGEDKNLGRWVNRQRSQFQAGRLRKDRQLKLEKLGLKWSMLATSSWDSMYEVLCAYVEDAKKGGKKWDGNVPANYKTDDNPPRALGRWINRQRSAFKEKRLKKECMDKLNEVGLKWSIHERIIVQEGGRNGQNNVGVDDSDCDGDETPENGKEEKDNNDDSNKSELDQIKGVTEYADV